MAQGTRRTGSRWIAVLCVLTLGAGCVRARTVGSARACSDIAWTPPVPLRSAEGSLVYVESPQVVQEGDSAVLIGAPTWAFDSAGTPILIPSGDTVSVNFAGVRVAMPQIGTSVQVTSLIGLPEGVWSMSTPRVARSPDGAVHALFRVEDLPGSRHASYDTAWTASLRGRVWTRPRQVLGDELGARWNGITVSTASTLGMVSHVATSVSVARRRSLALLAANDSGWTARFVRFPYHLYPDLLPSGTPSDLLVSYVDAGERSGINTLFVRRSTDGGSSWTEPTQVSADTSGEVHYPRTVVLDQHTLGVIWLEDVRGPRHHLHLWLATSTDGGTTWQGRASAELAMTWPPYLHVAPDGRGGLHVFLLPPTRANEPGSTPVHFTWRQTGDAQWVRHSLPTAHGYVLGAPAVVFLSDGRIVVFWRITTRLVPPTVVPPVTVYSVGENACR